MRMGPYGLLFAIFAAGCRFGVSGVAGSVSPPDLAMAISGGDAADLGTSDDSRDLARTPDLASPCRTISESFTDGGDMGLAHWVLAGGATLDGNGLQLTTTGHNSAGSAFYDSSFYTVGFDATFHFRMWDGSGADGLAFVFAKAASAAALGVYGNNQADDAWTLGYYGMNGYAVELDTYRNPDNHDPNDNHVGFMQAADGTHLLTATPNGLLRNDPGHNAHVRFVDGRIHLDIDGFALLDAPVPAGVPTAPDTYWFGFTGASGGLTDHHTISNFTLVVGPASCF